jgi:hypothetical protein
MTRSSRSPDDYGQAKDRLGSAPQQRTQIVTAP